jgi:hypothetical protein
MSYRNKIAALSGVGLASLSGLTLADVPAEVTTAITDAGTDIATIGGAILGLAVVAMTFKWLKASFF